MRSISRQKPKKITHIHTCTRYTVRACTHHSAYQTIWKIKIKINLGGAMNLINFSWLPCFSHLGFNKEINCSKNGGLSFIDSSKFKVPTSISANSIDFHSHFWSHQPLPFYSVINATIEFNSLIHTPWLFSLSHQSNSIVLLQIFGKCKAPSPYTTCNFHPSSPHIYTRTYAACTCMFINYGRYTGCNSQPILGTIKPY